MVGAVDPANLGRASTLYYHLVGATYGELFEAWAVAEGYLAERAARNEDRALVRATLERYLVDEGDAFAALEEFVAHHTEFHSDVGKLAGNRVMQLSLMAIGQTVTHHIAYTADPRDVADILLPRPPCDCSCDHRREADQLARQMRIHLEGVADVLQPLVGGPARSADRVAVRYARRYFIMMNS